MAKEQDHTIIGVVADTHLPEARELPSTLLKALEKVDVIFHLGDFCNMEAYKSFQKIAPLVAVHGNVDEPELRTLLPEKKTMDIHGRTIVLTHGWGPPKNIEKRVYQKIKTTGTTADIILFGHSHVPIFTQIEGITLFNPGSPTLNVDKAGTYGILEIGESVSHKIVTVE